MREEELNSLAMSRAQWAKLARELASLDRVLRALRSPNPEHRRVALAMLTGHEAAMVSSLSSVAAITSQAPGEVSPWVLT